MLKAHFCGNAAARSLSTGREAEVAADAPRRNAPAWRQAHAAQEPRTTQPLSTVL